MVNRLETHAVRVACSSLRYQMAVSVTKAGDTAPSQKPSRKRTVAKPAKLFGAARQRQTPPQMMLNIPPLISYGPGSVFGIDTGANLHSPADELGQVESAHQIDEGVLSNELTDKKDGRCPGILDASQFKVGDKTKYLFRYGEQGAQGVFNDDGNLRSHSSSSACPYTGGRRRSTSVMYHCESQCLAQVTDRDLPTMGRMVKSIFLSTCRSSSGVGAGYELSIGPCFSSDPS